ncbi:hypothetical protein A2642_01885 [Candidatus Nomurabacteria bacterium RIFCSPHIGHO2_01_FULL_39_10]|uniref:DUF3899 domain-containing protein n=1 Tax=Candidatus Nomurabacteria bacterium RIFCSPHIGHO2_01_FULL_39_10 TaxID=1801733 RepID=A0A1F6V4U7_9BACT|nr:MAG: hypothetical protein A2642_01885 [Candidatus Nomurabacteria bacterium RIFCSPHIGHO2_01_FULL_39_10]
MSPLDEIPRYVRYDFFMSLLGIIIVYFSFSNGNIYNDKTLHLGFLLFGAALSIYRIAEMSSTYYLEKKIQKLKNLIEIKELKKQIDNQENETLDKKSVINSLKANSSNILFFLFLLIVLIVFTLYYI